MRSRTTSIVCAAISAIAVWSLSGPLACPTRAADNATAANPGGVAVFASTASATVKAIDPARRLLTVQTADGDTAVIECGKNVVNFDKIQVGDQISAFLIDRVAVFASPEKGAGGAADVDLSSYAPKGEKPSAVCADTEECSGKVASVDAQNHTVTLQSDEGGSQTIKVSPAVDLSKVKEGAEIRLVCTAGVALADSKAKNNAQPAAIKLPPEQSLPGGSSLTTLATGALVTGIDPAQRLVTLQMADGSTRTIHLGKECINFDQIRPGDTVRATLAEQVAVSVNKPGTAPDEGGKALVVRAPEGSKPGIVIARTEVVTGKIASVNAGERTVTLTGAGGQPMTFKVGPNVNLGNVKTGDEVAVRVTRGLSIVVQGPRT